MLDAALVTPAELLHDPLHLDEGDAAIIMRKGGNFQVVNTHERIDPKNMTPEQLRQGKLLMAFALMAKNPLVLDFVAGLATDPEVAEMPLTATGQKH